MYFPPPPPSMATTSRTIPPTFSLRAAWNTPPTRELHAGRPALSETPTTGRRATAAPRGASFPRKALLATVCHSLPLPPARGPPSPMRSPRLHSPRPWEDSLGRPTRPRGLSARVPGWPPSSVLPLAVHPGAWR